MKEDFKDAIARAGILPAGDLILDGKLRRYRVEGDKKGRKNGWYRYVQVSPDYAFGVFGCNKRGISEKWSSKTTGSITKYEHKEKRRIDTAIREKEEELQNKVAIKANKVWVGLKTPIRHDYSDRKGVKLYGVREMHKMLVIPVYFENYLVSFQFVSSDGFKAFMTNGRSKDCYFLIGEETESLYICEGYATGASVYEAMGQQVCITFYASNIPGVAKYMRARWPDKKIIIAADNDQWTKGNPGVSYAQQAAAESKCEIKYPPFNPEDPAKPTDWNDWHARNGLKSLAEELSGIKKNVPAVREQVKWTLDLLDGKEEKPGYKPFDSKSKENAYLFLKHHEFFKDVFCYNIFVDNIFLIKCPPWEDETKFYPRAINETDAPMAVRILERLGVRTNKEVVYDYVQKIARETTINPPMQYFEQLKWDGRPRIDTWLTYYLGADKQAPEYLKAIGSRWIMGAVSRIYNPGCKFDNVLILEGKQDIKKSTAFEVLSTFNGESYFLEFSGDISNKDSLLEMHGNLVVELSELAAMARTDFNHMKSFITRKVDKYRPPYGRLSVKRPRYFVFGATTNNTREDGYLLDPTGGRRFWPAECTAVDIEALARDKDQLWAEAVYRYKSGERTWLEDDEKEFALIEQEKRQQEDSWMEPIEDFLLGKIETSVFQICRQLNLTAEQTNAKNEKRVVKILKDMGWQPSGRTRLEGKRITMWSKKYV